MDPFPPISPDDNVEIHVSSKFDLTKPYSRLRARIGEEEIDKLFSGDVPVLYETIEYDFRIVFRNLVSKPTVEHRRKDIRSKFTTVSQGDGSWLMVGTLDFVNEPGWFDLSLIYKTKDGKEKRDAIRFLVVSPKLDVRNDLNVIVEALKEEYDDAVFRYFSKTDHQLSAMGRSKNDDVWLAIFRILVSKYVRAVSYVVERPHLSERDEETYSRAERIRRWSLDLARKYNDLEEHGTLDRAYLRHEITASTYDTRENRFVRYTLDKISGRLSGIIRSVEKSEKRGEVDTGEFEVLSRYLDKIKRLSRKPVFRSIRPEALKSESFVLQKASGYSDIYRCWLKLKKSIELHEGGQKIGLQPLWKLYEVWCFIVVRRIVRTQLERLYGDGLHVKEDPATFLAMFSKDDAEHSIIFQADAHRISLDYQPTYRRNRKAVRSATTENRPDIVLTIWEGVVPKMYVFDPKYRVADDTRLSVDDRAEIGLYGADGADSPVPETLDQMHRYRDAIIYVEDEDRIDRPVVGAYVIFPGRGSNMAVVRRYYSKSINLVGVGAFPLLPPGKGAVNTLLEEHIKRILSEN